MDFQCPVVFVAPPGTNQELGGAFQHVLPSRLVSEIIDAKDDRFADGVRWARDVSVTAHTAAERLGARLEDTPTLEQWLSALIVSAHLQLDHAALVFSSDPHAAEQLGKILECAASAPGVEFVDAAVNSGEVVFIRGRNLLAALTKFLAQALTAQRFVQLEQLLRIDKYQQWASMNELKDFRPRTLVARFLERMYVGVLEIPKSVPFCSEPCDGIVFIHRGESEYVEWAVRAARESNPDTPIYLVADKNWVPHLPRVHFDPLGDFMEEARNFSSNYIHATTYAEEFERFCFERWFVLRALCHRRRIQAPLYLDSDVVLLQPIRTLTSFFEGYDLTVSHRNCGHIAWFRSSAMIGRLCDYLEHIFRDDKNRLLKRIVTDEALVQLGQQSEMQPLNDMLLIQMFCAEHPQLRIGDTTIVRDGSTFDHTLGTSQECYISDESGKILDWEEGSLYGQHTRLNVRVRFNAVHFQGGIRARMKECVDQFLQRRRGTHSHTS